MKTNPHHPQATVVLKDGNMRLALWSQSFDRHPTIGETVIIPPGILADLKGYEIRAVVSRIQQQENHAVTIDLEAACEVAGHDRPVIVLNSNRIPAPRRSAVESQLRSALRHPYISWEPSNKADPVVRFHDPVSGRKFPPSNISTGILDLIHGTAAV